MSVPIVSPRGEDVIGCPWNVDEMPAQDVHKPSPVAHRDAVPVAEVRVVEAAHVKRAVVRELQGEDRDSDRHGRDIPSISLDHHSPVVFSSQCQIGWPNAQPELADEPRGEGDRVTASASRYTG